MTRSHPVLLSGLPALLLVACSGGDGGTPPPSVASVAITAPTAAASFQTLGRTLQFSAQALSESGAPLSGVTVSWSSSATAVASISATGLLTVNGNGSTEIRASAGGVQSDPLQVTVAQVAAELAVTPSALAFGALGSSRQLSAVLADSGDAPLASTPTVAWSLLGPGTSADLTVDGVVTALAVGNVDTVLATAGALSTKVPINVQQVVAEVVVTADGRDTLETTGRTRTYSGVPRDSNANVVPGLTVTWTSTAPAIANVNATTGLAEALTDGVTQIQGSAGLGIGQRALTVRRYAETFTLTPPSASITTPGGTQQFDGAALDSVGSALPIAWISRATSVLSVSPASGAQTTGTATGNGGTFVVMTAGTRSDSSSVTVSGQLAAPLTATVQVGDLFFRSVRNLTENMAIDTIGAGGVVTWTWVGANTHNVSSQGTPSFVSSPLQTSGQYQVTFNNVGAYQYICDVHPGMTGRIVVR